MKINSIKKWKVLYPTKVFYLLYSSLNIYNQIDILIFMVIMHHKKEGKNFYSSLSLPFCVKSVFSKRRRKPITIFPVFGQLGFITRCLLVFFVRGCTMFTVSVSIWYLYWLSPQCSHIYILTVFDFFFVQYLILVFEAYTSTPKQIKTDAIF